MALNFGGNIFPPRQELINFDFLDVTRKTGYVTYYLAKGGSAGDYIWTTNSNVYSQRIKTMSGAVIDTGYVNTINITADLEFLVPNNLKGDLFINVPSAADPTGSVDCTRKITVGIYHYDGTTETQIGSDVNSGDMEDDVTAGDASSSFAYLKLPIASTKHFKKGEFLRVKIKFEAKNTSSTNTLTAVGHDPQNRTDRDETYGTGDGEVVFPSGRSTQLKMEVPFQIDL